MTRHLSIHPSSYESVDQSVNPSINQRHALPEPGASMLYACMGVCMRVHIICCCSIREESRAGCLREGAGRRMRERLAEEPAHEQALARAVVAESRRWSGGVRWQSLAPTPPSLQVSLQVSLRVCGADGDRHLPGAGRAWRYRLPGLATCPPGEPPAPRWTPAAQSLPSRNSHTARGT